MHRFFLPPEHFVQHQVTFPPPQARQIRQVLRLSPGQRVVALDDLGWAYELELVEVSPSAVHAWVVRKFPAPGEPRTHLTMLVCLSQREKFEWILQKCTEVGVSAFVPVLSARSLVRSASQVENKLERWHSILREAAEQCGRGRIPVLHSPLSVVDAMQIVDPGGCPPNLKLMAWEAEPSVSLTHALQKCDPDKPQHVHILIGPEGGFTPEEASLAQNMGYHIISLGSRIMRMETAAIVSAAITLSYFNDYEPGGGQSGLVDSICSP